VYKIDTDVTHNIVVFRLNGMVQIDEMEQFARDLQQTAMTLQGRPIKVQADVRGFKPAAPEVADMIRDVQEFGLRLGVVRIAEVVESDVVALQLNRIARESGSHHILRRFWDEEAAREWLIDPAPDSSDAP